MPGIQVGTVPFLLVMVIMRKNEIVKSGDCNKVEVDNKILLKLSVVDGDKEKNKQYSKYHVDGYSINYMAHTL